MLDDGANSHRENLPSACTAVADVPPTRVDASSILCRDREPSRRITRTWIGFQTPVWACLQWPLECSSPWCPPSPSPRRRHRAYRS